MGATQELPSASCAWAYGLALPSTPWLPPGLSEWTCVAQHGPCLHSEDHRTHCMTELPHKGTSSYFLGTKSRTCLHGHVGLCHGGGEGVGDVLWQWEAPPVGGRAPCGEGNRVLMRNGIFGWLWVLPPWRLYSEITQKRGEERVRMGLSQAPGKNPHGNHDLQGL